MRRLSRSLLRYFFGILTSLCLFNYVFLHSNVFKCFRESEFWYDICIIFQGLEDAVVGSNVYMAKPDEDFKEGELVKGETMRIILQNYIIFLGLIAVVMLLLPWLYLMC